MGVRADRRRRTVNTIVAAAGLEFAERGYEGASYQSIADRAGLAKSLVSYHFATKTDLVAAIFASAYPAGNFANTPAVPDEPLVELAVSTVLVAARMRLDPIARAGLRLQRDRDLIDAPVPPPYIGWVKRSAESIRKAAAIGQLPAGVDPESEARLLVGQYIGLRELADTLDERERFIPRAITGTLDRFRAMGAAEATISLARERAFAAIPPELR
jgi:AcrR family transcriptional regulator